MNHRLISNGMWCCVFLVCAALSTPAMAGPTVVVDAGTGRVISHDDAAQRWYPASLTKLMTTYVTFRAIWAREITLKSPVRMSANAAKEPPSKMGFRPGTELTVQNAIRILMVKSANDVATAVAESVGGSEKAFVARMNAEARRLGMRDTRFVNAHGLHSSEQYTTARDMALLALALRNEFPQYAEYFSLEAISFGNTVMENHNTLIRRFDGANGMKTGYTCDSGFNLIASAERNGRTLLAVVLGSPSVDERAETAASLLARSFSAPTLLAPRIADLKTSGPNPPKNMRSSICTADAREERRKLRNERGELLVRSAYLHEPRRPPVTVAVTTGGATGPESPVPRYADVPIPTPRPDFTPATAQGG